MLDLIGFTYVKFSDSQNPLCFDIFRFPKISLCRHRKFPFLYESPVGRLLFWSHQIFFWGGNEKQLHIVFISLMSGSFENGNFYF